MWDDKFSLPLRNEKVAQRRRLLFRRRQIRPGQALAGFIIIIIMIGEGGVKVFDGRLASSSASTTTPTTTTGIRAAIIKLTSPRMLAGLCCKRRREFRPRIGWRPNSAARLTCPAAPSAREALLRVSCTNLPARYNRSRRAQAPISRACEAASRMLARIEFGDAAAMNLNFLASTGAAAATID